MRDIISWQNEAAECKVMKVFYTDKTPKIDANLAQLFLCLFYRLSET